MKRLSSLLLGVALFGFSTPVFAHHLMAGRAPTRFDEGFLSGLAHPIINFEHFAFIIAIGVLTAVAQASRVLPVCFIAGTVLGCLLATNFGVPPFVDLLSLLSVALVGLALAFGRHRLGILDITAVSLAGILHGGVYAETIIGSDGSSLQGYLLGFAIIQSVVALAAVWGAYALWVGDRLYTNARIAGGIVVGVGLTMLAQTAAANLFPI